MATVDFCFVTVLIHRGCGGGSAVVDLFFQWKEPEPCGGRLTAAWISGIFYLFTVNRSLWVGEV